MKEIKTDKFCESVVSVRSFLPLDRKTISTLNLLLGMLNRTTESFDTRKKVSGATGHAYGVRLGYGSVIFGDQVRIEFRMSFLKEALIGEEGYSRQLIELFDQFCFHPLLCEEALEEVRYLHKQTLAETAQNPDSLVLTQLWEALGGDGLFSINVQGYLEDLDAITLDDIKALRNTILALPACVYVCGDLSDAFRSYLMQSIQSRPISTSWKPCPDQACVTVSVEKNISQSALCMAYTTGINPEDDLYYPFTVLNALLGSSSISLLFETVREQYSLCYSISTYQTRFGGIEYIHMDTDRSNLEQARKLIDQVLDDVREGRVDAKTFEVVKNEIVDNLRGQNDSPAVLIEQTFINDILNRPISLDEIIEKIEAVSLEDVSKAARRMKPAVVSQVLQSAANGQSEETIEETADKEAKGDDAYAA